MNQSTIYFDNAATTYPKPESVYKAVDQYLRHSANPGRGAYRLAMQSANHLFETRLMLAQLLGIAQAERLVFTPGCTYSINMALKGFPFEHGDTVFVGALEHNSVMRPLRQLERLYGLEIVSLPYAKKGIVDLHAFIQFMLERHPRLVVLSEGSNVTGEMIDLRAISAICGAHKVPLMVDAAQTAGISPYKLDELGVSIWCSSGHKNLYGPAGVGLLYVGGSVELQPIIAGGTGSKSEEFDMPEFYPDHLESGTLPGPAIAGLGAGAKWLLEVGVEAVRNQQKALCNQFLTWAFESQVVEVFGNRQDGAGAAVVSFWMPGVGCDRIAEILDLEFGISVRAGLHCASAAHRALGTVETGLVRASFGFFNTADQVDALCNALLSIAKKRDAGQLQA